MGEIRAVGMVIYTYERLEERLDPHGIGCTA